MIREATAEAATIPAAMEAARAALSAGEDADVKFEVLAQPQKKTLGLFGGSKAKVRAYIESTPADTAVEYVKNILSLMGLDVSLSVETAENGAVITLTGDGVGTIIGHHGETLDALQYLTGLASNKGDAGYYRITLNSGNYRQKREDALVSLARNIAAKAIKNERNYTLEPMNPYERRIIHTAVQGIEGVTSWSTGEAANRRVVIGTDKDDDSRTTVYRTERSGDGYRGGRGGRDSDRRGGYRGGRGGRDSDRRGGSDRAPYAPSAATRDKKTEHADVELYGKIN